MICKSQFSEFPRALNASRLGARLQAGGGDRGGPPEGQAGDDAGHPDGQGAGPEGAVRPEGPLRRPHPHPGGRAGTAHFK